MKNQLNGPTGIGIIAAVVIVVIALGVFLMNRSDAPAGKATGGAAATAKPYIPTGANANSVSGGSAAAAHNE